MVMLGLLLVSALQVGLVDMGRIEREYVDLQAARNEIDRLNREWIRQRDSLQQQINELKARFRTQSPAMTEEQRLEMLDQMDALEKDLQNFVQRIWGPGGEYARRSQDILQPYMDRIHEVIQRLATEQGLALVIDVKEAGAVFWDPALDLTSMVLNELNRTAVSATTQRLRIAVAPFLARTPETRQRGWAEIVEEEAHKALGAYSRIDLVLRGDVVQVADRLNARRDNMTLELARQIGIQVNAQVVVYGEVEWNNGQVHMTVTFLDLRTGGEGQIRARGSQRVQDTRTAVESAVRNLVQGLLERNFPEVVGR